MIRGAWLLAALLLYLPQGRAQWLETGSPQLAGMAHAGSAWTGELWQAQGNPAALAGIPQPVVGASLASHFLVQELSPAYLAVAVPFQDRHAVGLGLRSVGFDGYRETLVGLSYGIDLGWLALGARLNAQIADFAQYGSQTTWLVDAGVVAQPIKPLWLGLWVANATANGYPASKAVPLPQSVTLGSRYRVRKGLSMVCDAVWIAQQPTDYRLGIAISATKDLRLQLGVRSQPTAASFGVAFQVAGVHIAIATGYQARLGSTPVVGVSHAVGPEAGGDK